MQIVNTHYVPLQPPYPVIYCNGEVGMQTATLIVVEGPDATDSRHLAGRRYVYQIKTHSHPVVSYGNKNAGVISPNLAPNVWSEGVVWEHVELHDVLTLCHAPSGIPHNPATKNEPGNYPWIHFSAEQNIQQRLLSLVSQERLRDLFAGQQRFSLARVVQALSRIIPADLSIANPEPKGSLILLKGGLRPGESSITSNHIMGISGLFVAVKMQVEDYLNAVSAKRDKVQIEFKCRDEELQPLIDRLNADYYKPMP